MPIPFFDGTKRVKLIPTSFILIRKLKKYDFGDKKQKFKKQHNTFRIRLSKFFLHKKIWHFRSLRICISFTHHIFSTILLLDQQLFYHRQPYLLHLQLLQYFGIDIFLNNTIVTRQN